MVTVSDRVREIFRRRYPCREIPRGDLQAIAEEVGCSRELVRQLAAKEALATNVFPEWECVGCRQRFALNKSKMANTAPNADGLCRDCAAERRVITLPCVECGRPVKRSLSRMVWQMGYKTTPGASYNKDQMRAFCNRSCFGRYLGKRFGAGRGSSDR